MISRHIVFFELELPIKGVSQVTNFPRFVKGFFLNRPELDCADQTL